MMIVCSLSRLVRLACWIVAACLIAGVSLAHDADPTPRPAPTSAAGTAQEHG
ncbi:hypothetical protein [Amycolatopsis sacchari]|uniref:Uncharacterized protein n=1 Tax=Amycolatopsis sacchari TaxID=115433 RepID=A0A1I3UIH4_9PSEU|nr:hypothetical protein [Amycolatopsis sacchari]SFJ82732.1 hypothetical protein SAMN05421835_10974 [Amycolatopsis sacchari]